MLFPLLLTGCSLNTSIDALLTPPKLSTQQEQIYTALKNFTGPNISLKYPRAGDYLSAFIVDDIDNDSEEEAIVFYKKNTIKTEDVMKEKELNREERNKTVMETGALVMAEFYADWCPHCQKMMPIVKEFKELEKGKLEVVQINIEEESALADLYTVESIPTFILLRKGEALWRQSGEMNLDRLRKVVEDVVG